MKLSIFDLFGSVGVISLLQLATRTGIPRQSEIQGDFQAASSFLRLLLKPVSFLALRGCIE